MPRLIMLCTGEEVLHGQIVDTNGAWLADYLYQQGLPMVQRLTVGDRIEDLVQAFHQCSQQADIVIVNGGLGPTSDDLSAPAAAQALGETLTLREEWVMQMRSYFKARGREMPESNVKQAMLPESAEVIDNPIGTACGFAIQLNQCALFFTPGVPSEFKAMVEQQIMPRLRQRFAVPDAPLCLRLTTFGRSESGLAAQLDTLPLPDGVVMGYRSSMPIIEIKLTGPASKRSEMLPIWQQIRQTLQPNTLYEGTEGLPHWLQQQLEARQLSLALSEQCTAGLLSWQLSSLGIPFRTGELLPQETPTNLAQLAVRAQALQDMSGADIVLASGLCETNEVSVVLLARHTCYGARIHYQAQHHVPQTRQRVIATLLQDMLRRWLSNECVFGEYEWLKVTERLERAADSLSAL